MPEWKLVPVLEVTGLTCDDTRAHAAYARMVVGMNGRGMTCVYRTLQLWWPRRALTPPTLESRALPGLLLKIGYDFRSEARC